MGSGGKFIASVLQTSNEIGHWNLEVNSSKNTDRFRHMVLDYVSKSFPENHDDHLKCEPCPPFKFDQFSSIYVRGDDLTLEQVNDILANDSYIKEIACNNQSVMIVTHKPVNGFLKKAPCVRISLDSKKALRFAQKALLAKHYKITSDYILYKKHHPDYCNPSSKHLATRYFEINRPFRTINKIRFYKTEILDPRLWQDYTALKIPSAVSLDCILGGMQSAVAELQRIFDLYRLTGFDKELIEEVYRIWITAQKSLL